MSVVSAATALAGAPSLSELAGKKEALKEAHHKRSSSCFECHKDTEVDGSGRGGFILHVL